ncbi:MAG: hypothetical protein C4K60_07835 [Ideonella sp. MAG2]|nr:MAG: hypothetical protein C4K60_07835 [Ideonella sp. MAG2]
MLTQWRGGVSLLLALAAGGPGWAASSCPALPVVWQRLAPEVMWLPGEAGDATAANRGRVSGVLAVQVPADGRVWLLGSGPSPTLGRAMDCALVQQTAWQVSDVVNPWARPELVLGNRAWPQAALWAHEAVAVAMQQQCAHCEERLKARMGDAAQDLGADTVVTVPGAAGLAGGLVAGDQGALGPWVWWRLKRTPTQPVLVWRLKRQPLWSAPGLLWSDGPPDLRDATLATLLASLEQLGELARHDGSAVTWLPEQGPAQGPALLAQTRDYLAALAGAVRARQAAGGLETDPAARWPGLPDAWAQHPRHALNWQRAWRQAEDE